MSRTIYKLIVQPSANCVSLLRYVDKNIVTINGIGIRIAVEKLSKGDIDDDVLASLRRRGITRLPALIAPEGNVTIGADAVKGMLERGLKRQETGARFGGGDLSSVEDFWQKELYAGIDANGNRIPRKDPEDDMNDAGALERRYAEARRRRDETQRAGGEPTLDTPRADRRIEAARRPPVDEYGDPDNIAQPYQPPAINITPTGDARGDEMDRRMLDAWMNNNAMD